TYLEQRLHRDSTPGTMAENQVAHLRGTVVAPNVRRLTSASRRHLQTWPRKPYASGLRVKRGELGELRDGASRHRWDRIGWGRGGLGHDSLLRTPSRACAVALG